MMKLPGVIPAWEPWPWPHGKVKTGGWETLSSDGRVRPGFVSLNGEVMSHTKLPRSQPAGMQLTGTKREGRPSPQRRSVSVWQPFKPCFLFHLQVLLCVDLSQTCVSLCVFLFSREIVWLTSTLLLYWRLWGVGWSFDLAGLLGCNWSSYIWR